MIRLSSLFTICLLSVVCASAQRYTSPPMNTSAVINGDHITIDYYAPSMHGRKVMGNLVPYDEVWCTGANWATKITTQADLDINGLKTSQGELQHLDTAQRKAMDAYRQQADRTVSLEL